MLLTRAHSVMRIVDNVKSALGTSSTPGSTYILGGIGSRTSSDTKLDDMDCASVRIARLAHFLLKT